MPIEEVYHVKIDIPEANGYIEDWGYPNNPKEQYWRRKDLPNFFELVEYDKEGNALLDARQSEYAREEVRRCKYGFHFMSNGKIIYITGKNYFYLQWWKLEDDIYADFRMSDRKYFLFLDHWEKVTWCLGIIRGKPRRAGATSQATSNLIYECIFFKNSLCGFTSKTQADAKSAFTNMISFGYRQLPVFLKPKQLNNKDSVTELVFAHKSVDVKGAKGSVIDSDTGHRSKIDYKAPSLNAYDSGRISRICADEMGKWASDVPASQFLSIVSKTMVKGGKRVGFCELPSTVNELTKGGGAEFKLIWDVADFIKNPIRTPNRIVRYFCPSYEGFVGFIDKYGESVVDEPTEEQYQYLVEHFVGAGDLNEEDIKLGAKKYLLARRSQLEGVALEEEIRMSPMDEREMFMLRNNNCHFDAVLLNDLYDTAVTMESENIEYGNFVWEDGKPFTKAIWTKVPKENARWAKPTNFKLPEDETVEWVGNQARPKKYIQFISGADPFQNSIVESGKGSKACSAVLNRFENGTNDAIYNRMFVSLYHARPKMVELFHMDMALQCFAFGTQILIEAKGEGGIRKFFQDNGLDLFLIYLDGKANAGIDPNADNKVLLVNNWESYIEREGREGKLIYPKVIDQLIQFDINDTEIYDLVMGMGWTLVADFYSSYKPKKKDDTIKVSDYFRMRKIG